MSKTITTGQLSATVNGIKINASIPCNSANYNNSPSRTVSYVVMHYTGNTSDTARANATYFKNNKPEASAHLFVDETSIYQSVELRDIAWHCGGSRYYHTSCRNSNSIGIEMCCSGNYKISEKTKKNAAYLCAYICKLIGITADKVDAYVLRHWDVTHKNCPAQMAGSSNAEWTEFKAMVKGVLKGSATISAKTEKTTASSSFKVYKVRVTADALNIRKGAGTKYATTGCIRDKGVYTIVAESSGTGATKWGKLKSGAGWIALDYTKKI